MLSFYLTSILRETESENSAENGRTLARWNVSWKPGGICIWWE